MAKPVAVAACAALLLAGCEDYPKDPGGTLERARRDGTFRAAVVAGVDESEAGTLLRRVESAVKARARLRRGPGERLLNDLHEGRLDLVVGSFAKSSPWSKKVALSAPPGGDTPPDDRPVMRAAMRHGENAWIIAVETALRAK